MCSVSSITRTFSRRHSHTSRSTAIKLVPLSLSLAKSDQCPVSATTGIVLTTNATKTKENMTRRWRGYREHHRGMVIDNSFGQPPLAVLPANISHPNVPGTHTQHRGQRHGRI